MSRLRVVGVGLLLVVVSIVTFNGVSGCDSSSSRGGGPVFGQARFAQGEIFSVGTFGTPGTTVYFTFTLPETGTDKVYVYLYTGQGGSELLYVGQPADKTLSGDYDFLFSLVSPPANFGIVEVDLTSPPALNYLKANGGTGILTMAVNWDFNFGTPDVGYFLSTHLEPVSPDSFEPNDFQVDAKPVAKTTFVQGLTLEAGDHDYFNVQANAGESIDVILNSPHAMGNLQIEILDSGGTQLSPWGFSNGSSTFWNQESIFPIVPTTGTYTIHVWGDSVLDAASYVMEVDVYF